MIEVECAAYGSATCDVCEDRIAQGQLRVSPVPGLAASGRPLSRRWRHVQCASPPPTGAQFGARGSQIVPGVGRCRGKPLGPLAADCIRAWREGDAVAVGSLVARVQAEALAPTSQQVAHALQSRARQVRSAQMARRDAPTDVRLRRLSAAESRAGRERVAQARREAHAQARRDCPKCGEVMDALDVKPHLVLEHRMSLQEACAAVEAASRGMASAT